MMHEAGGSPGQGSAEDREPCADAEVPAAAACRDAVAADSPATWDPRRRGEVARGAHLRQHRGYAGELVRASEGPRDDEHRFADRATARRAVDTDKLTAVRGRRSHDEGDGRGSGTDGGRDRETPRNRNCGDQRDRCAAHTLLLLWRHALGIQHGTEGFLRGTCGFGKDAGGAPFGRVVS